MYYNNQRHDEARDFNRAEEHVRTNIAIKDSTCDYSGIINYQRQFIIGGELIPVIYAGFQYNDFTERYEYIFRCGYRQIIVPCSNPNMVKYFK